MLALGSLPILGLSACNCTPAEQQVNILWLWGEDISPWMPAFGDTTIKTPTIDFLADNGVTFTNCYSTASVSSPSRSALITGMMQTSIGAHNHRSGRNSETPQLLPDTIVPLPVLMREAGYYTYNNGKDDFNWEYDWNEYWSGTYNDKGIFGKEGTGSWADRSNGELFWGIVELYGGKGNSEVETPVDQESIEIPPYYPDCEVIRSLLAKHYNQILSTDEDIARILEELKRDGLYENTIIVFLSDNGYLTPRDKQFLYDGGIHMPLIISSPGNPKLLERFGVEMGEVRESVVSLLDVTATTLAMAGVEAPRYMESQNLFAQDYNREYIVAARDRCDFTIDRIRAIRTNNFKYIRNFMTDRPLMQSQYRDNKEWFQTFINVWRSGEVPFADEWLSDVRPKEELYDVVNDPHEINNLANDPHYQEQLVKMRGYLKEWIVGSGDQGQYPESESELLDTYNYFGERCVNPEYNKFRN